MHLVQLREKRVQEPAGRVKRQCSWITTFLVKTVWLGDGALGVGFEEGLEFEDFRLVLQIPGGGVRGITRWSSHPAPFQAWSRALD